MIKIPKEVCEKCGRCCRGKPGEFVMALTHKNNTPQISEKGKCQYLNRKNECKLGHRKPLECQIYPIRIFSDGVYADHDCPGWEIAVEQWKLTHGVSEEEWNEGKKTDYKEV